MSHVVSLPTGTCLSHVTIIARKGDGWSASCDLDDGQSVLVGSDNQCRLRLTGSAVSAKHCLFRLAQGEVTVQDWCSEAGTIVDGAAIDGEQAVRLGTDIHVGDFRLTVQSGPAVDSDPAAPPVAETPLSETIAVVGDPQDSSLPTHGDPQCLEASGHGHAPERDEHDAAAFSKEEPAIAAGESADTRTPSLDAASPAACWQDPSHSDAMLAAQQETIDLLKSEVALLQSEVAEQDARLLELADAPQPSGSVDAGDVSPGPSVEPRLQRLLAELERSDQRVRALEELLQAADEARLAGEEERQQLDVWVQEIERRIVQREQEWRADADAARRQVRELTAQRDRLHARLQAQAEHAVDSCQQISTPGDQTQLIQVQAANAELQAQLDDAQRRNAEFERRVAELQRDGPADGVQQQIDETLRAERLELAKERAEVSRQRVELAERLRDAQCDQGRGERISPADQRFRAFREHLKQIHEQERSERTGPTLTERLAQLWRRLDGPTDTD
jgi:hypothetical protein